MGRDPSNFGQPGDHVYLVPSNFCDSFFSGAQRVTSEALRLFIGRPDPQGKLRFKGDRGMNWSRKRVGAAAVRKNNNDSDKDGNEESERN